MSRNGFKRIAETWAVLFEKDSAGELTKTALKQTYDLSKFERLSSGSPDANLGVRIDENILSDQFTRGALSSKGNELSWDLRLSPRANRGFQFLPDLLSKTKLVSSDFSTIHEDLAIAGSSTLNGRTIQWNAGTGSMTHYYGRRFLHSWTWIHCNSFVDPDGKPADLIVDGLSMRPRLPALFAAPALASFYIRYRGVEYECNRIWDLFRTGVEQDMSSWKFEIHRGDLIFKGEVKIRNKDFAGLTFEDTDGTFLHCANSKLSDLTLWVYRSGKLESTLSSMGTAMFEIVSREKSPYVSVIL